MKHTEIEKYTQEITNISENLWSDYTKEECEIMIKDTKECLEDAKLLTNYKKKIKEHYVDIKSLDDKKNNKDALLDKLKSLKEIYFNLKNQMFIYDCPSCLVKLQIIENKLSICDDFQQETLDVDIEDINIKILDIESQIKKIDTAIIKEENNLDIYKKTQENIDSIMSQYEDEIDEENINDTLENITNYYQYQIKQEKKIVEIQTILNEEKFSTSFKMFSKDNNKLKLEIEDLENISGKNEEILREEELRILIIDEEKNKDTIERLEKEKISNVFRINLK